MPDTKLRHGRTMWVVLVECAMWYRLHIRTGYANATNHNSYLNIIVVKLFIQ